MRKRKGIADPLKGIEILSQIHGMKKIGKIKFDPKFPPFKKGLSFNIHSFPLTGLKPYTQIW